MSDRADNPDVAHLGFLTVKKHSKTFICITGVLRRTQEYFTCTTAASFMVGGKPEPRIARFHHFRPVDTESKFNRKLFFL